MILLFYSQNNMVPLKRLSQVKMIFIFFERTERDLDATLFALNINVLLPSSGQIWNCLWPAPEPQQYYFAGISLAHMKTVEYTNKYKSTNNNQQRIVESSILL